MKSPDHDRYKTCLGKASDDFELLCKNCGQCCGALDDPCHNLFKASDGKWLCRDYETRLRPQKTVSGIVFNCVSIREHISKGTLRPGCGYTRR